jgi:hypothetical protein
MGLDCSGFGMCLLGRAGYKSAAGTDWNSSGLYNNIYTRNAPDVKLGPRADELKAHFLWQSGSPETIVHVGFMCAPSQVVHAIDTSRDILMWYGLLEACDRAADFIDSIDAEMYDDTGGPKPQNILVKVSNTALSFLSDVYNTDLLPDIDNVLDAWSAYKDEAVVSPDEAHAFAQKFRARKMARDGVMPEGAATNADNYLYDISVLHDQLGVDGIREEIIARIFTLDRKDVINGSCISMTSEAKFIAYYNARTGLSVETRYMSYDVVNSMFRVPSQHYSVFGEGSQESE